MAQRRIDPNNPPNPQWISFQNLRRFSYPSGGNPNAGGVNIEATNWFNAVGRQMYGGLGGNSEIRGFPDDPKPPLPPRAGTIQFATMPPPPPPPPPPGPSNPQAFAIGGSIHSSNRKSFFK